MTCRTLPNDTLHMYRVNQVLHTSITLSSVLSFFSRCTFIFSKDILEDHSKWSLSKDRTLVNFVNHKCRALSTSPLRLMPDELHVTTTDLAGAQFVDLQGIRYDKPAESLESCLNMYIASSGLHINDVYRQCW